MREILLHSIPYLVIASMLMAIYYLSMRLAWSFGLNKIIVVMILGLLTIGSFVAMMVIMRMNLTSPFSHVINNISNIFIGTLILALCVTLLMDLVNIFLRFSPLSFGILSVSITAILTIYSLWNASHTRVYHIEIALDNLVEPLRIAHVSDTHFGHYWNEKTAQRLAKQIEQEDVDAVVITGDMFDGRARLNPNVITPFSSLGVPVFFCEGNHDGYSGSRDIKKLLSDNGIIVLENEKTEFKGLQIVGLNYLLPDNNSADTFHGALSKATMQNTLPQLGIDKQKAAILLHHNPVGAKYAEENGINLYLAGHTHAGQLFPATLFAQLMFEYNKGLYKYNDNLQIYVSQGTGTFAPPMRLGTHSELTIIELKNKPDPIITQ